MTSFVESLYTSKIIFIINSSILFLLFNWHKINIFANFSIIEILLIMIWGFFISLLLIEIIKSFFAWLFNESNKLISNNKSIIILWLIKIFFLLSSNNKIDNIFSIVSLSIYFAFLYKEK